MSCHTWVSCPVICECHHVLSYILLPPSQISWTCSRAVFLPIRPHKLHSWPCLHGRASSDFEWPEHRGNNHMMLPSTERERCLLGRQRQMWVRCVGRRPRIPRWRMWTDDQRPDGTTDMQCMPAWKTPRTVGQMFLPDVLISHWVSRELKSPKICSHRECEYSK